MALPTPEDCHAAWLAEHPPQLRFRPDRPLGPWREQLEQRFRDALGLMPDRGPLEVRVEFDRRGEWGREIRFVFTAEPGATVPCHLCLPEGVENPPLAVCLQGHAPGMHISLGRALSERDEALLGGDRDFARQAVARGLAALVLEQRCFGEREDRPEFRDRKDRCTHSSLVALLLGRTMLGERCWDVWRALDALTERFADRVDLGRVVCVGNSGGGKVSYYAACLDGRIGAVIASCSVCDYAESNLVRTLCADTYLPGLLRWAEMSDLAGLIAPRPLVVVGGAQDGLFPPAAVERTYATIAAIYSAAGVPEKCRLILGDQGHRFYAAPAWAALAELTGWY